MKNPLLRFLVKGDGAFIGLFLLPVVPDILNIVVIFHDVDELETQKLWFLPKTGRKAMLYSLLIFAELLQLSTNVVIQS
jgi:hypothetical protein